MSVGKSTTYDCSVDTAARLKLHSLLVAACDDHALQQVCFKFAVGLVTKRSFDGGKSTKTTGIGKTYIGFSI